MSQHHVTQSASVNAEENSEITHTIRGTIEPHRDESVESANQSDLDMEHRLNFTRNVSNSEPSIIRERTDTTGGSIRFPTENATSFFGSKDQPMIEEQSLEAISNEEVKVVIEFADVDNIVEEGVGSIDLDNAILTDVQKSDLLK